MSPNGTKSSSKAISKITQKKCLAQGYTEFRNRLYRIDARGLNVFGQEKLKFLFQFIIIRRKM
jgi:hypothetical protein